MSKKSSAVGIHVYAIGDPMDYWMKLYDYHSKQQGWSLFDCDGRIEICKIDDIAGVSEEIGRPVKSLRSDVSALNIVFEGVQNSNDTWHKMYLTALYFDGRSVTGDYTNLPKQLQITKTEAKKLTSWLARHAA